MRRARHRHRPLRLTRQGKVRQPRPKSAPSGALSGLAGAPVRVVRAFLQVGRALLGRA